jgi:hypothetical protein
MTAQRLREFSETYFGEHGGYAQQYLFHHARTASLKSGASRDSSTPKTFGARNDKRKNARKASRKADFPAFSRLARVCLAPKALPHVKPGASPQEIQSQRE